MSDAWDALRAFTPARIALGRAGNALPTRAVLEFQLAHARARDAVNAPFDADAFARKIGAVALATMAADRTAYLSDPDLGRRLSAPSRALLRTGEYDAALVIADGLSATAIAAHAEDLAKAIAAQLPDLSWAPATVVRNGRVAIGDEIAEALGAQMAVVAIGERPGLSAADSIGLYVTYAPRAGRTTDAERNCISNVRPGGLAPDDAARRLAWLVRQARTLKLSGVALKEDAPPALTQPAGG